MDLNKIKIVAIDPSSKRIGIVRNHGEELRAYLIENRCKYEDTFLRSLSEVMKKVVSDNPFLVYEYTYVPYLKVMSSINRVVGAILSSCVYDGYLEVSMNTIYAHYNIKGTNKKKLLHEHIINKYQDIITLTLIDVNENSLVYNTFKDVAISELPEDCLDAYSLFKFIIEKQEVK